MKILILTAATGGGHNRAAEAIQKGLSKDGRFRVETVDSLKAVGKLVDRTVCDSYLFMARRAPGLFGSLYKGTNRENRFSGIVPRLNRVFSRALLETIAEAEPDVIITTHPFSTQMVSALKERGGVRAALVCVITDYGLHKAWLGDAVDRYVVACEDMAAELVHMGVEPERILPSGIPVFPEFFQHPEKEGLREGLGLDPFMPTVLFMAGSFGVNHIISLYRDIARMEVPLQLVVITGKNQRLYSSFREELEKSMPILPTKLVYFTREVHCYMQAADLLVTKPGGLTISEALAGNLPMVVFNAIPGQEEDNAAYLSRHGMGIPLGKKDDLSQILSRLLADPAQLAAMKEDCRKLDTRGCMEELAETCQSLCKVTV